MKFTAKHPELDDMTINFEAKSIEEAVLMLKNDKTTFGLSDKPVKLEDREKVSKQYKVSDFKII